MSYNINTCGKGYNDLSIKERVFDKILDTVTKFGQKHVSSYYMRGMSIYLSTNGFKDLVGIEIGVGNGTNALVICKNLSIKKLYCVDPYCCDSKENVSIERYNIKNKNEAVKKLRGFDVDFLECYSFDAVDLLPDGLDFVYIDGCHSYDGVKRDIALYYPKVRVGGVLGGHDFNKLHFNVNQAVVEFADRYGLEINTGNYDDWWIIKKRGKDVLKKDNSICGGCPFIRVHVDYLICNNFGQWLGSWGHAELFAVDNCCKDKLKINPLEDK